MPLDPNDPQYIRFMTENINKEQEKRLHWFNKNKEQLMEAAQFPKHYLDIRTAEVGRMHLNVCLPGFSKDHQNSMINRRKKPIRDGRILGLSILKDKEITSVPKPAMLPVDPRVENILKVRLPYGGCRTYLKARNRLDPEEKYYNEETSSHVYGWKLKDSYVPRHGPKFGHYCSFIHSLYSRTGPHADPSYYQQPPREPYSKCDAPFTSCTDPGPTIPYKR